MIVRLLKVIQGLLQKLLDMFLKPDCKVSRTFNTGCDLFSMADYENTEPTTRTHKTSSSSSSLSSGVGKKVQYVRMVEWKG